MGDLVAFRGNLYGRVDKKLKIRSRGLFIEKTPFQLRSNFDHDFLLGLYLGLNLVRLAL